MRIQNDRIFARHLIILYTYLHITSGGDQVKCLKPLGIWKSIEFFDNILHISNYVVIEKRHL